MSSTRPSTVSAREQRFGGVEVRLGFLRHPVPAAGTRPQDLLPAAERQVLSLLHACSQHPRGADRTVHARDGGV